MGLLLVAAVLVVSCSGDAASDRPLVVATTTILGDIVSSVVGDDAAVEVLMPVGADPHDYEPSSRQASLLEGADLVVAVGLDLEEGLVDLLRAVEADGVRVLRIGPEVEPDWIGDSVVLDPHVWMDPRRMALAAELIAEELTAVGLEGDWTGRAASTRAAYEALDADIAAIVDTVPEERRRLVTLHDSLGYFAARYGFEVVGAVIEGGSSLGNPSSARLSALIDRIDELGIAAVFGEVGEPTSLLEAIAAEPTLDVAVVLLHVGSLSDPGGGAATYAELMRTDAALIAGALSR